MSSKIILTDIEGTIASIHFVKDVLFPYATQHLADFVHMHSHKEAIQRILADTAQLLEAEGNDIDASDLDAMIAVLQNWIDIDRKATPLKELQGQIWAQGYQQGDFKAHLYPDAGRTMLQWYMKNIPIYVYSSGSVEAQILFFRFNQEGNLLPLFEGFFDTQIGAKQDTASYQAIFSALKQNRTLTPADVLFLSDSEAELDAAKAAGFNTYWLVREGELPSQPKHPVARDFGEIKI